ncbi:MAG: hypothetical protein Ct9H300mP21_02410 [Pseudomonadota bacterium]|nr:MAG: hypothetical protein Ct9H300mP21_02410 [Pseudomonadota bacterium]
MPQAKPQIVRIPKHVIGESPGVKGGGFADGCPGDTC